QRDAPRRGGVRRARHEGGRRRERRRLRQDLVFRDVEFQVDARDAGRGRDVDARPRDAQVAEVVLTAPGGGGVDRDVRQVHAHVDLARLERGGARDLARVDVDARDVDGDVVDVAGTGGVDARLVHRERVDVSAHRVGELLADAADGIRA